MSYSNFVTQLDAYFPLQGAILSHVEFSLRSARKWVVSKNVRCQRYTKVHHKSRLL